MHKLIATSLLAALLVDGSVVNSGTVKLVYTDMIGPFKEFDEDTSIKFYYSMSSTLSPIYEELRCYDASTGASYSKVTKSQHYANAGITAIEFPVYLSKYFSSNGLKFEFIIYKNGIVISRSDAKIYPMEQKSINVTKDKVKSLVSKNVAFKIEENNLITYHDDFNFTGFKDYVDAENYHSLDLRGYTFLSNQKNLNYGDASVTFADPRKAFKYLSHDNNGKIKIKLGITEDNEKKGFKVIDNIYVNPYTLDIATYQISEGIKTNKIYLPVNKKKEFLGETFDIVLTNCGLNKYNFIFQITYDVFRDLVGNCSNSDYCIKGTVE